VSWTPEKSLAKGTYTATADWDLGPFGKLKATKEFRLGEDARKPEHVR
jgi:hypothetical protein